MVIARCFSIQYLRSCHHKKQLFLQFGWTDLDEIDIFSKIMKIPYETVTDEGQKYGSAVAWDNLHSVSTVYARILAFKIFSVPDLQLNRSSKHTHTPDRLHGGPT
jgi:hypothetical protein